MGSSLRRQLREALPQSIKGLPRAVALEIADDARWDDGWRYNPESGRRSKAKLADLVRWTASKNERVIRDALRNLSLAGWEFRLPMGKDCKGNPLYAVPGHALEFRVPDFEAPTVVGASPEGTVTTGPSASKGPVTTAEGPVVTAEGPVTTVAATVTTGPPSLIPPTSRRDPTSSVADVSGDSPPHVGALGGGGGGDLSSRALAEQIAAVLDYRGKTPDKKQRQRIVEGLVAALGAGWTVDALAVYLRLGNASVDSPAAVYAHRLKPDVLPDPPGASGGSWVPQSDLADGGMWDRAMHRAERRMSGTRGGALATLPTREEIEACTLESVFGLEPQSSYVPSTADKRVAQGLALAAKFRAEEERAGGHKPYSNDSWTAPANPVEAARIPHCGDPGCDPVSRLRDGRDEKGFAYVFQCETCHPSAQW